MPLNPNYKEEYYELLKKCVLFVEKSNRYEEIYKEYEALKKKINQTLEEMNAICTDCERLFDKPTGKLKPETTAVLGADLSLLNMLSELEALHIKRKGFEELGWTDGMTNNIHVVLAIGECRDMEKAILAELGRDNGQIAICEEKKKILRLEKELGLDFFREEVDRMEAFFKVKVLFPTQAEIKITEEDNLQEERMLLQNQSGECFNFKKYSQIRHGNAIYVELELLDDLNTGKFKYYKLERTQKGQRLIREEDGELDKLLCGKQEILEAQIQYKRIKRQEL